MKLKSRVTACFMAACCLSTPCWSQVVAQPSTSQVAAASTHDKIAAETPEAKKLKLENQRLAKQLLQRSYALTHDVSDSDRALILSRLAQTAARVMPEKAKAWGDEVFQITSGLSNDNMRGQYEMNVIGAMADIDPDHALQLLLKMSPPGMTPEGQQLPDLRSPASTILFQKYWHKGGEDGLPAIQATARQMGEDGIYPYMAMGSIIRQVNRKDNDKAQTLIAEALSYFSRLKKTDMSGQQVAMFLRSNRDLISTPVLKDVLTQLVNDALAAKDNQSGLVTSISTNGNTATLRGASNVMLYQLIPMIKEIDPEWAKKLEEQNVELRGAAIAQANSPTSTNQVRMMITSGTGPGAHGNPIEEVKAMEVDALAQKNPMEALKISNEISDPVLRAATGARLAGELNSTDPEQAEKLVKAAHEAIAATPEPADKLKILVGLAQAQASMKDLAGLMSTMDQAFSMGEDLYRKSVDKNPDASVITRAGVDSLNRLTTVGVKAESNLTIDHVDKLGAAALRAVLLISAAQGIDPEMKQPDSGFRIMIRN